MGLADLLVGEPFGHPPNGQSLVERAPVCTQ